MEGAKLVLQACLEHCSRQSNSDAGTPPLAGGGTPDGGSVPHGCSNQTARMVGIDVSHHQGDIDFKQVAADLRCFVYLKATEGTSYKDPRAKEYAEAAQKAGLLIGYYHFARPKAGDAAAEARAFLAASAGLPAADLVPALDLEAFERGHTLSDVALSKWAETWLATVSAAIGGKKPLIYLNRSWGNKMQPATTPVKGYPLWFANYVRGDDPGVPTREPRLPTIWTTYSLWQFTEKGRVKGIKTSVDLNLAPRGIAHLKLR